MLQASNVWKLGHFLTNYAILAAILNFQALVVSNVIIRKNG